MVTGNLSTENGVPENISDDGRRVVAWICDLYAKPDCALGGMLHFMIYDENVDDACFDADFSVFVDDYGAAYPADVTALCERVYDALKALTEEERFEVVSCANREYRLRLDASVASRRKGAGPDVRRVLG